MRQVIYFWKKQIIGSKLVLFGKHDKTRQPMNCYIDVRMEYLVATCALSKLLKGVKLDETFKAIKDFSPNF